MPTRMASTARTTTPRLGRDDRRKSILQAAAGAFAGAGFAATSMEQLAAEAGVTKLIVYRHFDSKEGLYRAVLERVSARLAEEFATAAVRQHRLGVAAPAFLSVAREDPAGFRLLWRHSAREPEFASYASEFRALAVRAARVLLADRLRDPALHDWAAETVVAYLAEAVLNWLDHGDRRRDDEFLALTTASLQALVGSWAGVGR
ncbi:MAG: TetR/AcrR family transcriptional regulator [Acidimicrobiales bacterium]|nr:TetR/AcrR family transcriptional regulator [Acidimicrobiales bacterium]